MERYIEIDGKRIELTEEQIKILYGDKKHGPMSRAKHGETYYFVNEQLYVDQYEEEDVPTDKFMYNAGNYFLDKDVAKQRAMHLELDALLFRASVEAGELDNPWDGKNGHYFLSTAVADSKPLACLRQINKSGTVYFPSEESARSAIDTIVKPFMAEHPDFVW